MSSRSPYQIFGMNFRNGFKSEAILENVWGTPGEDEKGEWKKFVSEPEFEKLDGPMGQLMYFSIEEFVLERKTQNIIML